MAGNLLRSSEGTVFVFDKNTVSNEAYSKLISSGATAARSVSELVKECGVVFSMLPASLHVRNLYMDEVLPALREKSLLIDCSTIDPGTARFLNVEFEKAGHLWIDAPVSGGIKGAESGTLTFMVGTSLSESAFSERVKPIFHPMGKAVYCGGPGVGQSVKICNNLILAAQMLGVAEGYRLAGSLGVEMQKFNEIVNSSTGMSWSSSKYNPVPGLNDNVPSCNNYKGGFMTDLMVKDLGLALDAAKGVEAFLPVTEFTRREYSESSKGGYGALDFSSIYKYYSEKKDV